MEAERRSSSLMLALESKRVNYLEFNRKCLEWAFETWDDLEPKQFPDKPQIVVSHEQIPDEDRKKLKEKWYYDNPEILYFYDKREHIYQQNKGRCEWLEEMLEYIKNEQEFKKVKEKMVDFKKVYRRQGAEIGYRMYIYSEPQVKEVVREFEGSVE